MKTIPLAEAIEILAACSAVIVDGATVTFPNFIEDEPECDVFLEVETAAVEQFASGRNASVEIDAQGQIVLLNTCGQKTTFMPLKACPIV